MIGVVKVYNMNVETKERVYTNVERKATHRQIHPNKQYTNRDRKIIQNRQISIYVQCEKLTLVKTYLQFASLSQAYFKRTKYKEGTRDQILIKRIVDVKNDASDVNVDRLCHRRQGDGFGQMKFLSNQLRPGTKRGRPFRSQFLQLFGDEQNKQDNKKVGKKFIGWGQ